MCLNILDCQEKEINIASKTFTYDTGICKESYKDGGVNKLIINALVEDIKESHANVKLILDLNGLNQYQYFCAFDMKLANILLV